MVAQFVSFFLALAILRETSMEMDVMKTFNVILKKKQTNKQVNSNFPWSVLFYHGNDTHVQYSRLDSSGQNLESNGVWSKNETGSTVEFTRVTGSLVTR